MQLSNGVKLPAEVKKFSPPLLTLASGEPAPDSGRDLALLRVPEGTYPAVLVSSREHRIGDSVHIMGFPGVVLSHELLDKSASIEASVTNGAVSGVKRDAIGQDLVQTDASAAHGNSGGPAVSDDGVLLGVMTFTTLSAQGGVVQGFNFLIPARDVVKFLQGTEVTKPGTFQLASEMNVIQIIAEAGGFLETANKGNVIVVRNENSQERGPNSTIGWRMTLCAFGFFGKLFASDHVLPSSLETENCTKRDFSLPSPYHVFHA